MMGDKPFVETLQESARSVRFMKVCGRPFSFFVLPKEFNPLLRFFCGAPTKETIFISEEVPEQFQFAVLTHEISCNLLPYEKEARAHCVACTKKELMLVMHVERAEYIRMRIAGYHDLQRFLARTREKEIENADVLSKVEASLVFLKTL